MASTSMEQRPSRVNFTASQWRRLVGYYGFIVALHVVGWGFYLRHAADHPALVGLGLAAYLFGLRHAFDADHIAAVDDTVRHLMQKGRDPLGVGFFFSLGHATVVFVLAIAIAVAAVAVTAHLPALRAVGGLVGASVSGLFLWVIGLLNLVVLLDLFAVWRRGKGHDHAELDALLARRGLLARLLGGRMRTLIDHGWQMYPLGLLFGLGLDTASEVALLVMTAGAATGALPMGAVVSLPLLFAAGMCLMDTTDGVLMTQVYDWARRNPLRRVFHDIATTGLSVAVALLIGTVELAKVAVHLLELRGAAADFVVALDFGVLGYVIVGLFMTVWLLAIGLWKFGRLEERYGGVGPIVG